MARLTAKESGKGKCGQEGRQGVRMKLRGMCGSEADLVRKSDANRPVVRRRV